MNPPVCIRHHSERMGIVLLLVLGVLALLSVLAITFVSMTRLEKSISRNYVDRTRAILTAESGLEYAVARLKDYHSVPTPQQLEALRYEENAGNPGLQFATKPSFNQPAPHGSISGIVASSYRQDGDVFKLAVTDESGKLNINDSNGKWNIDTDPHADSNQLGNGDDDDILNSHPRMHKIFENLVEVLFGNPTNPGIGTDAAIALFLARDKLPAKKFSKWEQVRDALVDKNSPDTENPLSISQFNILKKHITLWSWQDPDTIRPTYKLAISHPESSVQPDDMFNIYMYADFQTDYFELEPRAPVNINTCSQELMEALITQIQGWYLYEGAPSSLMDGAVGPWGLIQRCMSFTHGDTTQHNGYPGNFFIPYQYTYGHGGVAQQSAAGDWDIGNGTRYGIAKLTNSFATGSYPPGHEVARLLYERIHGDLNDPTDDQLFTGWDEFSRFIYSLVDLEIQITNDQANPATPLDHDLPANEEAKRFPYFLADDQDMDGSPDVAFVPPVSGVDGFDRYMADALLANFNPNSQLNDHNPDFHIFRHVDKSQLTQYTTEFCFQPTGYFTVHSLGMVLDQNNAVMASSQISTVMKIFHLFRYTTQEQFMSGFDPDDADTMYDLFYESDGRFPTSCADLIDGDGGIGGNGRWGPSLMTYPDPIRQGKNLSVEEHPAGARSYFSKYEGYMMLSTYQRDLDSYDHAASSEYPMFMAPMGYRWLPGNQRGQAWRDRSVAVGGMMPVRWGNNNASITNFNIQNQPSGSSPIISDNIDTMNVPGGRGALLAWNTDYTILELDQDFIDQIIAQFGEEFLDLFLGMMVGSLLQNATDGQPDTSWTHTTPWEDYTNWNKQPYDNADHLFSQFCHVSMVSPVNFTHNRLGWNTPSDSPVTPDVTGGQTQGNLFPDGVFSDVGRLLSYPATNLGSLDGTRGTLAFWIKPHYDSGYSNRPRRLFSMGHFSSSMTHGLDLIFFPASTRPDGDGPGELDNPGKQMDIGSSPGLEPWAIASHGFMYGWNNMFWSKWTWSPQQRGPMGRETTVMGTPTSTDFFPYRNDAERGGHDTIAFYGHQWNYLAMNFDSVRQRTGSNNNSNFLKLSINGNDIPSGMREGSQRFTGFYGYAAVPKAPLFDFCWEENPFAGDYWAPQSEPRMLHIGERYMRFGWGTENNGPVSDATFDEIATWAGCIQMPVFESFWNTGRYCAELLNEPAGAPGPNNTVVGLYTSAPINVVKKLQRSLAGYNVNSLRLLSVNWTLFWPRYNWRPEGVSGDADYRNWGQPDMPFNGIRGADLHMSLPSQDKPADDPVTGNIDPVTVDIYTTENQWLFSGDTDGDTAHGKIFEDIASMPACAAGSAIDKDDFQLARGDDFRFRVYFHLDFDQNLLESPVLDDITFVFAANKPIIISYEIIN
ncbi:hypothetical protein ACFL54_02810 [Planctomycetota bacterium]